MIKKKKIILSLIMVLIICVALRIIIWERNKTNTDQNKNQQIQQENEKQSEKTKVSLIEYNNQTFGYKLLFPDKWFMNNDDSNTKLQKPTGEDLLQISAGGQTFWSNYSNINDFDPQTKPTDFHLLSLIIYEDQSKNINDFSRKIGFSDEAKITEFSANNAKGMELTQSGILVNEPKVSIIFQKQQKFFVFTPAFFANNEESANIMNSIISSFSFL